AFFDVLENLWVARLKTDNQEPAACVFHRFESVAVGCDARSAGPGNAEGLQLFAEFNRTSFLDIEGVVIEEELFDVGEVFLGPLHFRGNVVSRALPPGVAGERLRPQ